MFERTTLFEAGEGGYYTFRIPALLATPNNVLLAFCAARSGTGGDWDPIDIVLRRSEDGGRTWDAVRVIVSGNGRTADNATPILSRDGTLHFVYQIDYARCFYLRSDNAGQSWTAPRDITATFEQFRDEYDWKVLAPGPGHAIQLSSGRLLVPVWLSTGEGTEFGAGKLGHRPSCIATIYSDDDGETWQRGAIVVDHDEDIRNPSEHVAVELADGRVLLNMRTESARHRRLTATSPDGISGWSAPAFDDNLFDPVCMASLIRYSAGPGERSRLLFCNPDSSTIVAAELPGWRALPRENLTVRVSYDEGQTWPLARVIDPGVAGYSDLAIGPDGTIFCLYEGGAREGNQAHNTHLSIARFDLAWLDEVGHGEPAPGAAEQEASR